MSVNLGSIFASVTLDLGGLKTGLASAKAQMSGFSTQIAQHASKAGAAFSALAKSGAAQQIGRDMALAGVAATTIYEAIKRGEIPATDVLGRIGLRPADVDAFQAATYGGVTRARRRRGPQKKDKPAE